MIRSMSDEQIREARGIAHGEPIPSRDPLPYVHGFKGFGHRHSRLVPNGELAPRPEFARPVVNPILAAFRNWLADEFHVTVAEAAFLWLPLISLDWPNPLATPVQVSDARRVLERLAKVTAVTK